MKKMPRVIIDVEKGAIINITWLGEEGEVIIRDFDVFAVDPYYTKEFIKEFANDPDKDIILNFNRE